MIISVDKLVPASGLRWHELVEAKLGASWPVVPESLTTEVEVCVGKDEPIAPKTLVKQLAKATHRAPVVLEWVAAQKPADRIVELAYFDEPIGEDALASLLAGVNASGVRRLKIDLPVTATGRALAELTKIEHLDVDGWMCPALELDAIAKLPALRSLRLFGPYNDGKVVDLTWIAKTKLERLALHMQACKLALPPTLAALQLHKCKELRFAKKLDVRCLALVAPAAALIARIAKVEELVMSSASSNEDIIAPLGKLGGAGIHRLALDTGGYGKTLSLKPLASLASSLRTLVFTGTFKHLDTVDTLTALEELQIGVVWNKEKRNVIDASKLAALHTADVWNEIVLKGWKKPALAKKPAAKKR